jgi:hypothetical protein
LLKEGEDVLRLWKHRFFQLRGLQLLYFDGQHGGKHKGTIQLRGAVVREADAKAKRKFAFEIAPLVGRRVYLLCAESAEERQEWIDALQAVIKEQSSVEENLIRKERQLARELEEARERLRVVEQESDAYRAKAEHTAVQLEAAKFDVERMAAELRAKEALLKQKDEQLRAAEEEKARTAEELRGKIAALTDELTSRNADLDWLRPRYALLKKKVREQQQQQEARSRPESVAEEPSSESAAASQADGTSAPLSDDASGPAPALSAAATEAPRDLSPATRPTSASAAPEPSSAASQARAALQPRSSSDSTSFAGPTLVAPPSVGIRPPPGPPPPNQPNVFRLKPAQ